MARWFMLRLLALLLALLAGCAFNATLELTLEPTVPPGPAQVATRFTALLDPTAGSPGHELTTGETP